MIYTNVHTMSDLSSTLKQRAMIIIKGVTAEIIISVIPFIWKRMQTTAHLNSKIIDQNTNSRVLCGLNYMYRQL